MLAVNSRAIKELVAANQKQLHPACTPALKIFSDVSFLAHSYIDRHSRVLFFESRVLSNFTIKWQRHAYLVATRAQLVRQRLHHIDQRARSLQRRPFRTDHQDSHSVFDVVFSRSYLTSTRVSPNPMLLRASVTFLRAVASPPLREFRQTLGPASNPAQSDRPRAPAAAE